MQRHSVQPLFSVGEWREGGGELSVLPNFQKEELDRISIFRGELLGKREVEVTFFEVGGAFFT